ncbi:MAG: galactose-1-phosphate uridylyltransferase [Actinobacteria bacterium]|jgi:UDPglucose--hexose-1-phosphate uridylyltransferase|nr:galactose-1-phosphate uridylyltransferase [Actinomycetota bacterium]
MSIEQVHRTTLCHADGRYLLLYGDHGGDELAPLPVGEHPPLHLRWNALDARWTAISPARNTRPQTAPTADAAAPSCPLCPGGPEVPFAYEAAVFENRFPTLLADPPAAPDLDGDTAPSVGRCEVVLYTPTHTGSLATLEPRELARVIAIWADRSQALWAVDEHRHVLVFENRGEGVGATLAHPHGQIYALGHVPSLVRNRLEALAGHRAAHDTCLTCDVVERDTASERVLLDLPGFVVAVPFAPDWPYEIHVRAKRHGVRRMHDLDAAERRDLAVSLRDVVSRYDRLFDEPMSYMMVCQQAPAAEDGTPAEDWHLAFEFLPPNRAADRTKFRASVETSTGLFINDTIPEMCAAMLAEVITDARAVTFPEISVGAG